MVSHPPPAPPAAAPTARDTLDNTPPPFQPAPAFPAHPLTLHDVPDAGLHAIFAHLPPRDLARAGAVCTHWRQLGSDKASDETWRTFFQQRWRPSDAPCACPGWRVAYGRRLAAAAALASPRRPAVDILPSHRAAARAVALLPCSDAVVTGAADRTVRVFRLSDGALLASSPRLPASVRCVGVVPGPTGLLVAGSGADPRLAVWRAGGSDATPFDVATPPTLLPGHTGPVAAVAVDNDGAAFYSASWDGTVRVWRAGGAGDDPPTQAAAFPLTDWGWSVAPRGGRLLVAEGRGAVVFDAATGAVERRVPPRAAAAACGGDSARADGGRDGRTLFLAHAHGGVDAIDLRAPPSATPTCLLRAGGPPPSHLSHDDPWLALAAGRAGVALLDARHPGAAARRPPRRLGWTGGGARCADVAGRWVAAGWDDGGVRTWRFGGAGEED